MCVRRLDLFRETLGAARQDMSFNMKRTPDSWLQDHRFVGDGATRAGSRLMLNVGERCGGTRCEELQDYMVEVMGTCQTETR